MPTKNTSTKNTSTKNTSIKSSSISIQAGSNKENGIIRKITRRITRNILEKSYDSSAIIFIILSSLGKTTLDIMLKPSYYVDDPSIILGEIDLFKQNQLEKRKIKQALDRLRKYGLVKKKNNEYILSNVGEKLKNRILGYQEKLEEKWDEKYRLVIFDIPEIHRQHRNWLRAELYFLGYTKLQNSVFISKKSLTEDIVREIKERGIEDCVNYLLVDYVYDLNKQGFNTNIK